MVTTTSDAWTASAVRTLGCSAAMSTPTSAIACTATGLTCAAGAEPAGPTSTAHPASADRNPAAICDRPALCTHTNRTLGLSVVVTAAPRRGGEPRGSGRHILLGTGSVSQH